QPPILPSARARRAGSACSSIRRTPWSGQRRRRTRSSPRFPQLGPVAAGSPAPAQVQRSGLIEAMRLFRSRARTRAAKLANPPHRFNGYAADMDSDHNEPSVPYGGPGWLTVIDVQKSYRGRMVVKGVSLETGRGEAVGLLGPNGAGKTTVFYMVTGLVP